jgi:hypothetical protein
MYEGEGTVIYGANHTASLRVKISSTDPDVLYLMKERSRCGNVYGPWKPNGFGIKPYFEWIVNGFDAVAFLTTIRPWLGSEDELGPTRRSPCGARVRNARPTPKSER